MEMHMLIKHEGVVKIFNEYINKSHYFLNMILCGPYVLAKPNAPSGLHQFSCKNSRKLQRPEAFLEQWKIYDKAFLPN